MGPFLICNVSQTHCRNCDNMSCPRHMKSYSVLQTVYYACYTHKIFQELSYSLNSKASVEFWNALSKTIISERSLFRNKAPVNIWNNQRAQK